MTAYLLSAWAWIQANPVATIAIVLYVIANIAPRPSPSAMVGWRKALWETIDRLCLLTAGALPGAAKALFAPSPSPRETPTDPPKAGQWLSGPAVCLACGHEWEAVAPLSADLSKLECPRCGAMSGSLPGPPKAP